MTNTDPRQLRDSFKYLFTGELEFLIELTKSLPSNPHIVNIGAGAGTSASAFLFARPDSKVYSVDIQFDSSPFGSLKGEAVALGEMGLNDSNRYTPITGKSHEVARQWDKGKVDFIFVDDGHSYDECRGDIELWLPHLKSGGIIAIHDFDKWEHALRAFPGMTKAEAKPWPGVDKAVRDTLFGKYEFLELTDTIIAFRNTRSTIAPKSITAKTISEDELVPNWVPQGNV